MLDFLEITLSRTHIKEGSPEMKKSAAILAAGLIGFTALVASPAAHAAEIAQPANQGVVIAQDTSRMITATPSAPRAIQIQAQPRDQITVSAKGEKARKVRADAQGQATVNKLTAGKPYTVRTKDASTTVTPVINVGRARDLQVTTTDAVDTVNLTWQHNASKKRGGEAITYTVEADPMGPSAQQEPAIIDEVSTTTATLSGLDPTVRYSFTVTPHNALGNGEPSVAMMNRSLSAITGVTVASPGEQTSPQVPATQPSQPATPNPAPNPTPDPGPAPAPKPSTKTIYVCPDGFSDDGGVCTKTMGYTYQTQDYTYTYKKTGTETYTDTCSSGYTDENGQFHWIEQPHPCTQTRDVFGNVKGATPSGWEDTGSNWRKKDDAPSGWMDDGSQWVQTTGKVEKVVPA